MAIINYYEKFGFSQTDALENIQCTISQKLVDEENDSFGEGHSDKMFFLESARDVFATKESKAQYDQKLADSMKQKDPDGERKKAFEKWYGDAKSYFYSHQYDLAKTAIDRAFQYSTPDTADFLFYTCAQSISLVNGHYSQAIEYANQAIVLAPDLYSGYYTKMTALDTYMHVNNLSNDTMQDIWRQLDSTIKIMIDKAIASGYKLEAAEGYGLLAKMYYVAVDGTQYPITGANNVLAEEYAVRALSLLEHGQEVEDAKKVANDIAARRAKIAHMKKARDEMDKQNKELSASTTAIMNSGYYNNRVGSESFGGELKFAILIGIVGIIALVFKGYSFGAICLIVAAAIIIIKALIIRKNKMIRAAQLLVSENRSKIESNTNQINIYKNIIAQQSNGLAPKPFKI